jgi:hypothetical protein
MTAQQQTAVQKLDAADAALHEAVSFLRKLGCDTEESVGVAKWFEEKRALVRELPPPYGEGAPHADGDVHD